MEVNLAEVTFISAWQSRCCMASARCCLAKVHLVWVKVGRATCVPFSVSYFNAVTVEQCSHTYHFLWKFSIDMIYNSGAKKWLTPTSRHWSKGRQMQSYILHSMSLLGNWCTCTCTYMYASYLSICAEARWPLCACSVSDIDCNSASNEGTLPAQHMLCVHVYRQQLKVH